MLIAKKLKKNEKNKEMNVKVCDCYSQWKMMHERGIDTTQLLINRINHPVPEMHNLFADMLFDVIIDGDTHISSDYANTMFREQ